MKSTKSLLSGFVPAIEPERVVIAQYGPRGLIQLDSPTVAGTLTCYGCGGSEGYFNLAWNAWCCRNEKCWGPVPDSGTKSGFQEFKQQILTLRDLGAPEKYQDCDLKDCYHHPNRVDLFRDWAKKPKGFLIFSGSAGSGKTFAAYAIVHEFLKINGSGARFFNVADLYFEYRNEISERGSAANLLSRFVDCKLLLLDDLGQRTPTDAYLEFLYVLINKRYEMNLATIVTTNLNGEGLEKRLGEAIASRVLSGQNHFFDGKDRRLPSNKITKIEKIQ